MTRVEYGFAKKSFAAKLIIGVMVFLIFFLLIGLGRQVFRKKTLAKEIADLRAEVEKQERVRENHEALLHLYESDFFAEREARVKFNLQKPGETVVVVPLDGEAGLSAAAKESLRALATPEPVVPVSNPVLWRQYFFGE